MPPKMQWHIWKINNSLELKNNILFRKTMEILLRSNGRFKSIEILQISKKNTFEKDNGNTYDKSWQILKTENITEERNDRRRRKNIYEEGIENAVIIFPVDWLGYECLNICNFFPVCADIKEEGNIWNKEANLLRERRLGTNSC